MRIARDLGGVASLFPEGVSQLSDAPYTLHQAITLGLQFLGFLEMQKDERPPRGIWLDVDRLEEHFRAVERRREEKYGGKDDEIENPVRNEAAAGLIVGDD